MVTGGTGGIDCAICRRLDKTDYQVVACYFKDGAHEQAKKWQSIQKRPDLILILMAVKICSLRHIS